MSEASLSDVLNALIQMREKLEENYLKLDKRLARIEEKTETKVLYTKMLSPPITEEPEEPVAKTEIFKKIRNAGIEPIGKIAYAPDMIKPVNFLGDEWGTINEILKNNGYAWRREGRNSRWEPTNGE